MLALQQTGRHGTATHSDGTDAVTAAVDIIIAVTVLLLSTAVVMDDNVHVSIEKTMH